MRPYAPDVYHPAAWRGWQDFGTSWIADMGTHLLDATWRGFDLKAPASVVAEVEESWKASQGRRAENWPQAEHVTWTFPGGTLTDGRPLTVEWFDGEMLPPADVRAMVPIDPYPKEAALWIGTEGVMLQIIGSGPLLYPAEKFKDRPRPKPEPRNHTHHYVDACLGLAKTESHFAQTGPTAEAILLATIAVRCFGHTLTWNPAGMKIGGCAEAQGMLRRTYRSGW
jgi:predicted dehydrogenase